MQNTTPAPRSRKPVYMVLGCTVFAAAAQIMMKYGATHPMPALDLNNTSTVMPFVLALLTNYPLVLGYALSAGNAMLLILALRDGQLSTLYPIISLTFVWVNLLSIYLFGDHMNLWKGVGILLVITGVGVLGKASEAA
jgi:multidrug transporter EmrE-like cation transporter